MKRICIVTVLLMFGLICLPQKNQDNSSRVKKSHYNLVLPPKPIDPQL